MNDRGRRQPVEPQPDLLLPREPVDAALLEWLKSESFYFHVTGSPGTGKTSWATLFTRRGIATVAGKPPARLVASHFCERTQAASWSPAWFLKSVAEQIARSDEAFAEALLRRANERGGVTLNAVQRVSSSPGASAININIAQLRIGELPARDLVEPLLLAPLRTSLDEDGPLWIVLVDAIDEAQMLQDDFTLRDLLLSLGPLPARMRFVLTSRPDPLLERELGLLGALAINLDSGEIDGDALSSFAAARSVTSGLADRISSKTELRRLLAAIAARAGRNFLVARSLVDMLAAAESPPDVEALRALPTGLASLYLHYLSRLPPKVRDSWLDDAGRVAGVLTVAREPLDEQQVALATRLPTARVRASISALRQYLTPAEGRTARAWRIFHQTFIDFLGDRERAAEYWLPPREQHLVYAEWARGASSDWSAADDYIIDHAIQHIAAADHPDRLARIEQLVTPAYLAARAGGGGGGFRLIEDFELCIALARSAGDVAPLLFWSLLKALWLDRAAVSGAAPAAIVYAAAGRVGDALELAAGLEPDDSADPHRARWQRQAFAAQLTELGQTEAAIAFAGRFSEPARSGILTAVAEAIAVTEPSKAIQLLGTHAGKPAGQPTVRRETCRLLALHSDCIDQAWAIAGASQEHRAAVAAGCAVHDLPRALELIGQIRWFTEDVGGERLLIEKPQLTARAIAAFIAADKDRAEAAWGEARRRLSPLWRGPDAYRLAFALAEASPDFGCDAFLLFELEHSFLSGTLAAAYMAALAGPDMLDRLAGRFPAEPPWKPDNYFASIELGDVCPMLAIVDPRLLVKPPHSRELARRFADDLISVLSHHPDRLERPQDLVPILGRLCGLLDDDLVRSFAELVKHPWSGQSLAGISAQGVATGLAERSAEAFLSAMAADLYPQLWDDSPTLAAAQVIAARRPDEALPLLDAVAPRFFATRAALAGIIGTQMHLQRRGDPRILIARLSPYVEGATFIDTMNKVTRAAHWGLSGEETPGDSAAERALKLIEKGEAEARFDLLRQAAATVDELEPAVGVSSRGETIWPWELRRRIAAAVCEQDPDLALATALPEATLAELRPIAARLLAMQPELADPLRLYTHLGVTVAKARCRSDSLHAGWTTALAFALELTAADREAFLDLIKAREPDTFKAVSLAALAERDPRAALRAIAAGDPDDFGSRWAAHQAMFSLAKTEPAAALATIASVAPDDYAAKGLAKDVAEAWPLSDWRLGIAAFRNGSWERECCRALLRRAGAVEPRAALLALAELQQIDTNYTAKDVIVSAAAEGGHLDPELWPDLLARAVAIDEDSPRRQALEALLLAVERLPNPARRWLACESIAAVAAIPGGTFLASASAIVRAAAASQPALREQITAMAEKLRELLSPVS